MTERMFPNMPYMSDKELSELGARGGHTEEDLYRQFTAGGGGGSKEEWLERRNLKSNTAPISMNEQKAREILGGAINDDNSLSSFRASTDLDYAAWCPQGDEICMDGDFTLDQLRALVWWMENNSEVG